MIYTINELRKKIYEKVYEVYDVFQNFFGEDAVDLQGLAPDMALLPDGVTIERLGETDISDDQIIAQRRCLDTSRRTTSNISNYTFILVYWPIVTVTNENGKSVDIQELYAKIWLTIEGTIPYECTFGLNRSRYSQKQFCSGYYGYLHSHVSSIPKHDFTIFQSPCLGTGPIRNTIGTLKIDNDSVTWMLFCDELAKYVTVESLRGGPYNRLEDIGNNRGNMDYQGYSSPDSDFLNDISSYNTTLGQSFFKDFIAYYLKHGHLNVSYKRGTFICGMDYFDYIIDVSNAFIDFYNSRAGTIMVNALNILIGNLIKSVVVSGNKFYTSTQETPEDLEQYKGKHVCYFKEKDITLTIDGSTEDSEPVTTTVLNHNIAMHILCRILRTINYRYKNGYNKQEQTGDTTSTVNQKVCYI